MWIFRSQAPNCTYNTGGEGESSGGGGSGGGGGSSGGGGGSSGGGGDDDASGGGGGGGDDDASGGGGGGGDADSNGSDGDDAGKCRVHWRNNVRIPRLTRFVQEATALMTTATITMMTLS